MLGFGPIAAAPIAALFGVGGGTVYNDTLSDSIEALDVVTPYVTANKTVLDALEAGDTAIPYLLIHKRVEDVIVGADVAVPYITIHKRIEEAALATDEAVDWLFNQGAELMSVRREQQEMAVRPERNNEMFATSERANMSVAGVNQKMRTFNHRRRGV